MNIKNLSFYQVWKAQKLFQYDFCIDYCQNKANGASDALSRFFYKNPDKKNNLWANNMQNFH